MSADARGNGHPWTALQSQRPFGVLCWPRYQYLLRSRALELAFDLAGDANTHGADVDAHNQGADALASANDAGDSTVFVNFADEEARNRAHAHIVAQWTKQREEAHRIKFEAALGAVAGIFDGIGQQQNRRNSLSAPHGSSAVPRLISKPAWASLSPSLVLKRSELTELWVCRRLSNFECVAPNT